MRLIAGREGTGRILRLDEPLSFWGGIEPESGQIIDVNHPQFGASVRNVLLAMPHGRGSSSSSSVLAETIRIGTAPSGLILDELDEILLVGALVANDLYQKDFPIGVGNLPESASGVWILDEDGLRRA